jgi:phosphoribosyl-AMP cyclohydrolase / phosphoribosyl-ATP pyrophosphohydrolase
MTPNRPLVVCSPTGRPVAVLEENEKGYRKSLEQGHLWALHPGTGRLLPFYEESGVTVVEHDGWYEAVLDDEHAAAHDTRAPGADRPAPSGSTGSAAHTGAQGDTAGTGAPGDTGVPSDAGVPSDTAAGAAAIGPVLRDLAELIARRHAELPEGSYTTHLFTSGPEKIRKKTGEEAIELLLASTRETIVSESADLLYHLLVLLESESIPLGEIAAELSRR